MRVTALEIRRRESDRMGVMATWPGWSIVAHTSGVQSQSRVTLEAPAQAELRPTCAVASRLALRRQLPKSIVQGGYARDRLEN
jgi:hypothetical protein